MLAEGIGFGQEYIGYKFKSAFTRCDLSYMRLSYTDVRKPLMLLFSATIFVDQLLAKFLTCLHSHLLCEVYKNIRIKKTYIVAYTVICHKFSFQYGVVRCVL